MTGIEFVKHPDDPEHLASLQAMELRRARRRRYALRALPALAAVVAVAFTLSAPWEGGGRVSERALAAIGRGPVTHIVTREDVGQAVVDLRTGRRTVPRRESEVWYEPAARRFHLIARLNGQVAAEFATGRGTPITPSSPFDVFPDGYRQALLQGTTRTRKGRWHGRPIYWVAFEPPAKDLLKTEVGIDRTSYKPVVIRQLLRALRSVEAQVVLVESVPFRAADFSLRYPGSIVKRRGGYSSVPVGSSAAAVRAALGTSFVWPGRRVAGMRLSGLERLRFTRPGGAGIELDYGLRTEAPPSFARPYLTIQEARGGQLELGPLPAEGSVGVGEGSTTDERGHEALQWTGLLRRGALTISIASSEGEQAVVAAATALRAPR